MWRRLSDSSIADVVNAVNFLAFDIRGQHDFFRAQHCDDASQRPHVILAATRPNDAVALAIACAEDSVASMPLGSFDPIAEKIALDDLDAWWAVA